MLFLVGLLGEGWLCGNGMVKGVVLVIWCRFRMKVFVASSEGPNREGMHEKGVL